MATKLPLVATLACTLISGCAQVLDMDDYPESWSPPAAADDTPVPATVPPPAAGCSLPMADCDGDGACDTDLRSAIDHCGVCGEVCGGVACVEGACLLGQLDGAASVGMTVDDTSVYLSDLASHHIWRLPQSGEREPEFFSEPAAVAFPTGVYADQDHVYWVGQTVGFYMALFRQATGEANTVAETIWTSADPYPPGGAVGTVVGNGTSIYWALRNLGGGGDVFIALKSQAVPPQPFGALPDAPTGMVAAGDGVFVLTHGDAFNPTGSVWSVNALGPPEPIAAAQARPYAIAMAGTELFWANIGPDDSSASGSIARMSLPTGSGLSQTLASEQAEPAAIELDETHVYWVNSAFEQDEGAGELVRMPRAGGAVEVLNRSADGGGYYGLAMTDDHVFYSEKVGSGPSTTRVYRRSKEAQAL